MLESRRNNRLAGARRSSQVGPHPFNVMNGYPLATGRGAELQSAHVCAADITGLLKAWSGGDKGALEQLMPLVYAQLHAQARRYMRSERADLTLQSTALVHEVYLRLTKAHDVTWNDRAHFFALSAQIMRRILVDAARARTASKRGGGAPRLDPRRRTIRTGF